MLGALGHAGLEAEFLSLDSQIVVEQEFGICQSGGFLSEEFVDLVSMQFDLCRELIGIVLRCKRVGVGHSHELHTLGCSQRLEAVDHLGHELLKHLKHLARDSKRAAELAVTETNHLLQRMAQRQIGGGGKVLHLILALHIFVVIMVSTDVKEAVTFHAERCVHLEAKTYIFHNGNNL